jgi:hypothetical protein
MSLLKHVQFKIIFNLSFEIIRNSNNIYNHYDFYRLLLKKMDIPVQLYNSISTNFKILFLHFLSYCDKNYKKYNIIHIENQIYYIGKNIDIIKLYEPTEEDINLLYYNKNIPYLETTHKKDVNIGDTIYHDLIKEQQYDTITKLVNNNEFDVNINNYCHLTPLNYVKKDDLRMKKILNL